MVTSDMARGLLCATRCNAIPLYPNRKPIAHCTVTDTMADAVTLALLESVPVSLKI